MRLVSEWYEDFLDRPIGGLQLSKLMFLMVDYELGKDREITIITQAAYDAKCNSCTALWTRDMKPTWEKAEAIETMKRSWRYILKTSKGTRWEEKVKMIQLGPECIAAGIKQPMQM